MGKWIDCNRREREKEKKGEVGEKSDAIDTLKLQKEESKVHSIFFPQSAIGRHTLQWQHCYHTNHIKKHGAFISSPTNGY